MKEATKTHQLNMMDHFYQRLYEERVQELYNLNYKLQRGFRYIPDYMKFYVNARLKTIKSYKRHEEHMKYRMKHPSDKIMVREIYDPHYERYQYIDYYLFSGRILDYSRNTYDKVWV